MREGMCKHFKGTEIPCGKNHIPFSKAGGIIAGRALRIPCINKPLTPLTPSQSFYWNARESCSDYEEPTAEDITEHNELIA